MKGVSLVRLMFVALLAVSASGLADLVMAEPCQLMEATGQPDSDCPATCVRCSCSPLAIELLSVRPASSPIALVAEPVAVRKFILSGNPSEVLHVPKLVVL